MPKYQVLIKSPASFYKKLFRGRYQVVTPPFNTKPQAENFVQQNKKFDEEFEKVGLKVPYRYRIKRVRA